LCFVFRVLVTTARTTVATVDTTPIQITVSTEPAPGSMQDLSSAASTLPDLSSAASTLPDSTETIFCKDPHLLERQEGVPTSNMSYSISFRYAVILIIFKCGI
jgi:hypothetical protein